MPSGAERLYLSGNNVRIIGALVSMVLYNFRGRVWSVRGDVEQLIKMSTNWCVVFEYITHEHVLIWVKQCQSQIHYPTHMWQTMYLKQNKPRYLRVGFRADAVILHLIF